MSEHGADGIAIVGVAVRFPGAADLAAFWRNLLDGVESIARFDGSEPVAAGDGGARFVPAYGALAAVDSFDAGFFGFSPRDAALLDPQHRVFLEVAWSALEDSGYCPERVHGPVGVYAGVGLSTYLQQNVLASPGQRGPLDDPWKLAQLTTGDFLSTRVAHKLDLHGPAVTVQTACSTGLVAVHSACQSLLNYECDMALAGAVSILLPQDGYRYVPGHIASPDGHCRPFDADAGGTVPGSGAGALVLKRVDDALEHGDSVRAVIRGSAINNDGARKAGYTAPSPIGQAEVIRAAHVAAEIDPSTISMIECHGTGTAIGDPIEVRGLELAFEQAELGPGTCALGSVKSNVGHLDAAAGIAGLVKATLAVGNGVIPATLHYRRANPRLELDDGPFYVAARSQMWQPAGGRRRAGVSSFGIGGTNAHLVIEQPPVHARTEVDDRPQVLVLSARSEAALRAASERLATRLEEGEVGLVDTAYTLQVGRRRFEHRRALICSSVADASARLRGDAAGFVLDRTDPRQGRAVAFLFSGQGAQTPQMGREVYLRYAGIRREVDRCLSAAPADTARALRELVFGGTREDEAAARELAQTSLAQPALFVLELALARYWLGLGVEPTALLGHSLGELVAATVAGVFHDEDAVALVVDRARRMQSVAPGSMLAVRMTEAELRPTLCEGLGLAAVNGTRDCVVSGETAVVAAFAEELRGEGVDCRPLQVSHAFHSAMMDPVAEAFAERVAAVERHPPDLPILSNVTGEQLTDDEAVDPSYWSRQLRQPVRFAACLDALFLEPDLLAIEIGPGRTLVSLAQRAPSFTENHAAVASLDHVGVAEPAERLATAVARSWLAGADIDWAAFHAPAQPRRISLPSYPFERERHWIEPGESAPREAATLPQRGAYPLGGRALLVPGPGLHQSLAIGPRHQPYLADHVVHGRTLVPASFYLATLLSVAIDRLEATEVTLEDVRILRPLIVEDEARMHVELHPDGAPGRYRFVVSTTGGESDASPWITNSEGRLRTSAAPPSVRRDLGDVRAACSQSLPVEPLFDYLETLAIEFRPRWRWMAEAWAGDRESLVRLVPPAGAAGPSGPLHPGLIDNGFGSGSIARPAQADGAEAEPLLPYAIGALRFYRPVEGAAWCCGAPRTSDASAEVRISDLVFWNDAGEVVAEVDGFAMKRAPRAAFVRLSSAESEQELYRSTWQPSAAPTTRTALAGVWAVVADAPRVARALRDELVAGGVRVVEALDDPGLTGIVCAWDSAAGDGDEAAEAERVSRAALELTRRLATREERGLRMAWVTRGATRAASRGAAAVTTLAGLGKVLQSERPEWRLRLIDVDPELTTSQLSQAVVAELAIDDDESSVSLTADGRRCERVIAVPPADTSAAPAERAPGTILITGGLGALGLATAEWLASAGYADRLVLVGRNGPSEDASAAIEELRRGGVDVDVARVDVADEQAIAALLSSLADLRGIVHAAGVLEDGVLSEIDGERLLRVMRPKVRGAWNLHRLTRSRDLELFVMYSSIAALFGGPGQGSYAAANAALDGLARHRHELGLPALSIAWSPWSRMGMAARLAPSQQARLARLGLDPLEPERALSALGAALERSEPALAVASLRSDRARRALGERTVPSILRGLVGDRAAAETPATRSRIEKLPPSGRETALSKLLRSEVARVIGVSDVSATRPLQELGLDSLTALELRNALSTELGETLPATLLFDHPTIASLAEYLSKEVLGEEETAAEVAVRPPLSVASEEPIAVVGLGCRYPGAAVDPDAFWALLERGDDAVSEVPPDRWDVERYYDPDPDAAGKAYSRWGGFVDDIDRFDAGFFGISPREARHADPQLRMLLEVGWEALERARMTRDQLSGSSTGVYVGYCGSEYQTLIMRDDAAINPYSMLGTQGSAVVGRLSYVLGLEGPNMPVDTACSSSLVAVHLACQALRAGECSVALAGGVNAIVTPKTLIYFSRLRALSPTGRCRAFSAEADGYVRSEGCGMVVLERLSDALAKGDDIWAVIRGSAVNQDGRSQGLTAPKGPAQEAVIAEALRRGGLLPGEVDYVECHGTGTPLGDPIEVHALGRAYGRQRPEHQPLWIGSVKSNIGHTEGAAGVAGLIKAVLSLRHGRIPASLHVAEPNPHVSWDELPVKVCSEPVAWRSDGRPRRAGVSSFGFSGTNAHVILEEAPAIDDAVEEAAIERPAQLVCVTARSAGALCGQAGRLAAHLRAHPAERLGDVAYSLVTTRSQFAHRLAVRAGDGAAAAEALEAFARDGEATGAAVGEWRGDAPSIGFLFTGQGSQYANMGRGLYEREAAFREVIDRCAAVSEIDLLAVLHPGGEADGRIDETAFTQPALYAVEVALAALWRSWGIEPAVLLGHSVGEYAAASTAGVFSVEDGMRLVEARGRLMQALPEGGAMASIGAPEARVAEAIGAASRVSIAALNGPEQTVISGDASEVGAIAQRLADAGVRSRALTVSHAFHSPLVEPMLEAFEQVAAGVSYSAPELPVVSNVSGELASGEGLARAAYWVEHVRAPVRFADGVAALLARGVDACVEIGPKPTLCGMAAACAPEAEVAWVASLREGRDDGDVMLEALGRLYVAGAAIDWDAQLGRRAPVALPTYAFERERFWLEATSEVETGDEGAAKDEAVWEALESDDALAMLGIPPSESAAAGRVLAALRRYRAAVRDRGSVARTLYELQWRARRTGDVPAGASGRWLVCTEASGVLDAVAAAIERAGGSVTRVGSAAEALELESGRAVRGVVCGWRLDGAGARDHGEGSSVCDAARTLRAVAAAEHAPRIWCITRAAIAVEADDVAVRPDQTGIWGLGKVAALEHGDRWGGLIDVPASELDEAAADAVVWALCAADDEDQVAVRAGGTQYVPRLVARRGMPITGTWSTAGTVLVTGGLGALGREVARWAVAHGAARVVVTGRRGMASDGAAELIAALGEQGAEAVVAEADASDRDAMARVLADIDTGGPPLSAVFHLAGVPDETALGELTEADVQRVFRGKALGAEVLDELVANRELDAFVCFSSIASAWGAGSQAAYAAANAYLDGLAERRRRQGRIATAINWGPWSAGGMVDDEGAARLRLRGLTPASAEDMLCALELLLGDDAEHAVVATVDWARFRSLYELERSRPLVSELPGAPAAGAEEAAAAGDAELVDALRGLDPEEQRARLEQWVRGAVAGVLGMGTPSGVEVTRGFFDLGMDSLMALELRKRAQAELGVELSTTVAFNHPHAAALADHLLEELGFERAAVDSEHEEDGTAEQADLDALDEEELAGLIDDEWEAAKK